MNHARSYRSEIMSSTDTTGLHESVVMPHQKMTFYLLQCVERHLNKNQKTRPAKKHREALRNTGPHCKCRQNGDQAKKDRAGQRDPRQDVVDELVRLLAGTNAGNKASLTLHRVGHLLRVHRRSEEHTSELQSRGHLV